MSVKAPVPATVARFNGSTALVIPDDHSTAHPVVRDGHWVPRKDLVVGDKGNLVWTTTPSSGLWNFEKAITKPHCHFETHVEAVSVTACGAKGVLNKSGQSSIYRSLVTCPACLAWMEANPDLSEDRSALTPFLRASGVPCPVHDYITTGRLPTSPADRATLRSAADQAQKWQAADTKRAGYLLGVRLDGVTS